jgi:hypothetical protein
MDKYGARYQLQRERLVPLVLITWPAGLLKPARCMVGGRQDAGLGWLVLRLVRYLCPLQDW